MILCQFAGGVAASIDLYCRIAKSMYLNVVDIVLCEVFGLVTFGQVVVILPYERICDVSFGIRRTNVRSWR